MSEPLTNKDSFSNAVKQLWEKTNPCTLCPRQCKTHRSKGQIGFCGIADLPKVSSAGPHFGEEPVLVGPGGSGTIFFAGCNLGCVFCQNYDISHLHQGREINVEQLSELMLDLQSQQCSNINLVTPTHLAAPIAEAILTAKNKALTLPIVYNTGGYDSVNTLKLLEGLIDIYMPDMKYSDWRVSKKFSDADDYPEINKAAVKEMHRQVGDLKVTNGLAERGLLVRHLVLPDDLAGSFEIIDFLAEKISPHTVINVMDQYRPCYKARQFPEINRRGDTEQIERVIQYAVKKALNVIT